MSTSSRMRVTGFSGMDVESMVQQLMDAESLKVNKYKRQAISTEWKQTAYQKHATSLTDFNSKFLSTSGSNSMSLSGAYSNFKTSVTLSGGAASKAVGINASSKTKTGDYKIETLSTAKGATATASGLGTSSTATGGLAGLLTGLETGGFKMTANGKEVTVSLDSTKVAELATKLTAGTLSGDAVSAELENMINEQLEGLGTQYVAGTTAAQIQANDGSAKREGIVKIDITAAGGISFSTSGNTSYTISDSATAGFVESTMGIKPGFNSDYSKMKLSDIGGSGSPLGDGATFTIGGKTVTVDNTDGTKTVQDVLNEINNSGGTVKASYDAYTKQFSFTSTETGKDSKITLDDTDGVGGIGNDGDFKAIFGQSAVDSINAAEGTDAVIELTDPDGNVSILESSTNTITDPRSNLSVTVNSMAASTLEVSVEKDTAKGVENIKAFVEAFNTLLTDLRTETKTRRAKSDTYTYYEPLLDEEKEELSESQIEKMESKAKEGILYNDSILSEIVNQIESMMMEQVDIGGKNISLADIGITTTSDYTKGGILEINEEKLTAFLEENSDDVYKLFTVSNTNISMSEIYDGTASAYDKMKGEGIAKRLATIVSMATSPTDGSITKMAGLANSAAKATDNELYNELIEKNNKINDMLEMLEKKEDNYYKKFSAMETAMSKANSQMSSLTSLLG